MGVSGTDGDDLRPFQTTEPLNHRQTECLRRLIGEDEQPVFLTVSDRCCKHLFEVLRHHNFLWVHVNGLGLLV